MSLVLAIGRLRVGAGPSDSFSFDEDALAYLTAVESHVTLSDEIKLAVNQLYLDLKGIGATTNNTNVYTKLLAFYPTVGGTADAHKYNGKDPRDLDAAFRLAWSGGITHSANGWQGDGATGFADTFLNPSVSMTANNTHGSAYCRTNNNRDTVDFSAHVSTSQTLLLYIRYAGVVIQSQYSTSGGNLQFATSTSAGHFCASRTASNSHVHYRNGNNVASNANSGGTIPNTTMKLGKLVSTSFTDRQYCFFSFGQGLTNNEAKDLYDAVQKLQVSLGRNV